MRSLIKDIALRYARSAQVEELDLLRTLAQIPAPSHHEERRARFVRDWFERAGAQHVEVDSTKNVICHINDDGCRPIVVFAAHMDIAFDDTGALPLEEEDGGRVLRAPGVGDNTANLTNLLMATKYLLTNSVATEHSVLVVANSCEEGLGNLDGTKALFQRYGNRITEYRSFDGYFGQCTNDAVGSHRFRISCKTTGGHSFVDFGNLSAIKVLADVIEGLYEVELPLGPKTTFNIGTIAGGTTINSIAESADMLYEYRSSLDSSLEYMRLYLDEILARYSGPEVTIELKTLGIRPGNGELDNEIINEFTEKSDDAIREILDMEPDHSPFSTDSNIPLSMGIAANTIGTVRGGSPHTYEEWIETKSLESGLALVLALMLGYAQ